MTEKSAFIYALKDPQDDAIRYIGKSVCPERRYQQHLESDSNSHKANWIKRLLSDGLKPVLSILEEVPYVRWQSAEREWIRKGRALGWPLTNMTKGGDGAKANKDKWLEVMEPYLLSDDWVRFSNFDKATKITIARATAMEMMEHSWIGIKARGGDPKNEFDVDVGVFFGQRMAASLINAMCDDERNRFTELIKDAEARADQLLKKAEAVVQAHFQKDVLNI